MTGMSIRKNKKSGFTLLEIMISLALIAVALLAVSRHQARSLELQAEARFNTIAAYLALDRLSRIQCRDEPEAGSLSGDFGPEFPYFRFREDIEEIMGVNDILKVKVIVSLDERESTRDFPITVRYLYRQKR